MDAADRSSAPSALAQLTKVPIAQLSPKLDQKQEKCIEAAVTLVWPYSSSTKCFSLLLAEPDFRLRRVHGQVKAVFHGRAAEKVAASHVGIGDSVCVALKGSDYVANDTTKQTPGRYVAWDVHFDSELSLEVKRSSKDSSTIFIEQNSHPPQDSEQASPSTPHIASIDLENVMGAVQTAWESPAFLRSGSNQFGGALRTTLEASAEEDGFVPGKGRKRPRYSLKRDDWHLVEDPMSPQEEEELGLDWWEKDSWEKLSEDNANGEEDTENAANVELENTTSNIDADGMGQVSSTHASREASPIFIKPSLDMTGGLFRRSPFQSNDASTPTGSIGPSFQDRLIAASHRATDTPQLRPIPSPGLPIPSPIVSSSNNSEGYFTDTQLLSQTFHAGNVSSEPDASVITSEPISSSNNLPVSPQHAPPIMSEDAESSQNDENFFAAADVLNNKFVSPFVREDQPADMDEGLFSSQPEIIHPSEYAKDMAVEPAVEEQHPPLAMDHEETQSKGLDAYEKMDNEEDFEMEYKEYAGSNSASEVEVRHEYHDINLPEAIPFAHETLDADTHVETREAESEEFVDDDASDASQTQQHRVPSRADFNDKESLNSGNESLYYDEDEGGATDFENHDGDDGEAQWGGFTDDESEAEDLPKPPPAQPDIIVLDSDSEDELTSDQPVAPKPIHAEHGKYQSSSPQSQNDEWDSGDEEVNSESEVEESGDDEPGDVDLLERVHESDKEDESSVDVLARDSNIKQLSSRESSVYDDKDEADAQAAESGAMSPEEYHSDNVIHTSVNTGSEVIDLDSDEDQASRAGTAFPREDSAPASRIEKAWSDKIIYTLDGENDHDVPHTRVEEETIDKQTETAQMSVAGNQLLTPDPTQEAIASSQVAKNNEKDDVSRDENIEDIEETQEDDVDQTVLSPSKMDAGSSATYLPPDHNMPLSHLEQESVFEGGLERNLDGNHADDSFVIVPTTEPSGPEEQPETPLKERPEPPKVVISQLPAPDRHAHGLRSKLSYFAPLATLVDHFGALVDTLSVVHDASPIAKATGGSKDYFMTVQLTDPSMAGTLLQAQIFRRYKSAMPSLVEGNTVLLRNFKVRSYDHSIMLVSVESSSWAVFDGSGPEAQVNGPPVEYDSEERAYASGLRKWYGEIGSHMVADHQLQASIQEDDMDREGSAMLSESGSMDSSSRDPTSSARGSRRRKSYRRVTIHELRDGRRYTEVGSPSTKESIHELRDGTVYANL